ncbi:hypothetical protein FHS02_003796 [Massilia umbonata]|uniref:Uncharacterized protein n=1 Tax=Pseudoduganella umbonata TaxID=864828 RepID=A0A7W5HDT9_9BURK|nr:hypothetical protein [Pseudoduganella umbonata]
MDNSVREAGDHKTAGNVSKKPVTDTGFFATDVPE